MKNIVVSAIVFVMVAGNLNAALTAREIISSLSRANSRIKTRKIKATMTVPSDLVKDQNTMMVMTIMYKSPDKTKTVMTSPYQMKTITNGDWLITVGMMGSSERKLTDEEKLNYTDFSDEKYFADYSLSINQKKSDIKHNLYAIELEKKIRKNGEENVKGVYYVDYNNKMITKLESYDKNGKLINKSELTDIKKIDGFPVATKMETTIYKDNKEARMTTVYTDIEINKDIPDSEFELKKDEKQKEGQGSFDMSKVKELMKKYAPTKEK